MAVASPERISGDLYRLLHRGRGARDCSLEASRILARAVKQEGAA